MVTIAASRVWTLSTLRWLSWTNHALMKMTIGELRTRLCFLQMGGVPVPLPRSRAPPGSSWTDHTVTVRNSLRRNQPQRTLPSTGTLQPVELPKEQAGPSHGVPLVSFGAPPTIRCQLLHRRVSQTFLEIMIRLRFHLLGG